ncbi:MAG TPA: hypothetical protein VFQ61_01405 [Polyangiaceae bacterium]|nr:hypothetical protein [Polyangiaceae bacterium]
MKVPEFRGVSQIRRVQQSADQQSADQQSADQQSADQQSADQQSAAVGGRV